MSESYIQNLFAERIGGRQYGKSTAIYKFEKIKRAKRAAMAAHPGAEIIDMGVGEPDEMAFPGSGRASCAQEARKPENRGYADNGDAVLKQAAARYLERVCGVPGINPETEVIHSIGSKAALSILPAALINPGDYVLMTTPGYPVFGTHAKYYGGLVHNLPLTAGEQFPARPRHRIPAEVLAKAKVLVLTTRTTRPARAPRRSSSPTWWRSPRAQPVVVIHDAAYAALVFEGKPLSFLATPGAKEVGVELHSASKSFNMTGWRCGFVAGNELLVKAYGDVKDNTDSGQFLAIQHAAAYGFDHPEITEQIAAKYSRRMDALVAGAEPGRISGAQAERLVLPLCQSAERPLKTDGTRHRVPAPRRMSRNG